MRSDLQQRGYAGLGRGSSGYADGPAVLGQTEVELRQAAQRGGQGHLTYLALEHLTLLGGVLEESCEQPGL